MTCRPESPHDASGIAKQHFARSGSAEAAAELEREIERRATPVVLPPNCVVFREGNPPRYIYLLRNGAVSFTICAGPQTLPCFKVGSGSLVGLSAVIADAPYALTATASVGAELLRMDSAEFLQLIESRAEWYMSALRKLAEETLQAHRALAEMLAS